MSVGLRLPLLLAAVLAGGPTLLGQSRLVNHSRAAIKVSAQKVEVENGEVLLSIHPPAAQALPRPAWDPGAARPAASFEGQYRWTRTFPRLDFLIPPGGTMAFHFQREEGAPVGQAEFHCKVLPATAGEASGMITRLIFRSLSMPGAVPLERLSIDVSLDAPLALADPLSPLFDLVPPTAPDGAYQLKDATTGCCIIL